MADKKKQKYPGGGGPAIGMGGPTKRVLDVAKQIDKAQGGISNTPSAPKRMQPKRQRRGWKR